jgi:outer membrane protein assembly factor BamB
MIKGAISILLITSILMQPVYSDGNTKEPTEWNQYLNDPGHIGYYNGTGPLTNHTANFTNLVDSIGSVMPPVIDSDTVYIVTDSWTSSVPPKLKALNKKTLALKWEYSFESDTTVVYAPVLYKDLVIITGSKWHMLGDPTDTLQGRIYAVDKNTGTLKWKYIEQINTIKGITLDGDRIYFGAYSYYYRDKGHFAYAMDAATGKVTWRAELPGGQTELPASGGDYVVYTMQDGTVIAFQKEGAKKSLLERYPVPQKAWEANVGGMIISKNPTIYENHVLFTRVDGNTIGPGVNITIFSFNLKTGALEWEKRGKCGSTTWASGAVFEGAFIIPMGGGIMNAYNITSGALAYSFNASDSLPSSPVIEFSSTPIAAKSGIYVGGTVAGNYTLFCLGYDGKLIWFNRTKSNVFYVGAFSNGELYSVSYTGPLVVFDGVRESGAGVSKTHDLQAYLFPVLFIVLILVVGVMFLIIKTRFIREGKRMKMGR